MERARNQKWTSAKTSVLSVLDKLVAMSWLAKAFVYSDVEKHHIGQSWKSTSLRPTLVTLASHNGTNRVGRRLRRSSADAILGLASPAATFMCHPKSARHGETWRGSLHNGYANSVNHEQ
eukprot:3416918-Amphidinium_carterae.2